MSLPPSEIPLGAMRFNSDSSKLEYWNGTAWFQIQTFSPNYDGGVRGFFIGGLIPSGTSDRIEFITISTQGNATDFGNLTRGRSETAGFSNATRALVAGDSVPGSDDTIDVWTMSSSGNASDFGNLLSSTNNAQGFGGLANATRGIFGGGYQQSSGGVNILQFVTINSNGNTVDFGDLGSGGFSGPTGGSSPTRGLWFGGKYPSDSGIRFITIASTGDAQDFGDTIDVKDHATTASNAVRIVYFHGQSNLNTIEFVTTATLGNATDFGDMALTNHYGATSNSSATRGCLAGGWNPSGEGIGGAGVVHESIEYVEIMTQGNAVDFGNLSEAAYLKCRGCISTGHGGLG